jgi:hypothetical protein
VLDVGGDRLGRQESVLRIHERAGHPTDEIYEVPVEAE